MKTPLTLLAVAALSPAVAQAQDAAAGERTFAQCRTCHQIGETAKNAVGPQLNGLFGSAGNFCRAAVRMALFSNIQAVA